MSYKPADFYIGVMEFFSILMPGALLTFLWLDFGARLFGGGPLPPLSGPASRWIAFIVASYVLGHLLHHVGGLLDKWIYDKLYVKRWKRRKGEERLLTKAREVVEGTLGADATMTSTFSWAASFVRAHNAAAANEIERGGADSKFFRSLALVAAAATAKFAAAALPTAAIAALLLLAFAVWRFCDRRWNNVQLTYEYFVMLAEEQKRTGDA